LAVKIIQHFFNHFNGFLVISQGFPSFLEALHPCNAQVGENVAANGSLPNLNVSESLPFMPLARRILPQLCRLVPFSFHSVSDAILRATTKYRGRAAALQVVSQK
jgi:hypothetical protein